jgi:signal transduction histidine kinase
VSRAIAKTIPKVPKPARAEFEELSEEVLVSNKNLKELLELTNSMGILDRDATPVRIDLHDAVEQATKRFARVTKRYEIEIVRSVPEGLQVGPMLKGEVLAILINVISNSIKSVIAAGKKRLISISAERQGRHVRLDVRDTGIGVPEEHFAEVFTPMISDPAGELYENLEPRLNPEDSLLLGGGSGLGLSIVRGILEARRGHVELLKPAPDWKFHLSMDLP